MFLSYLVAGTNSKIANSKIDFYTVQIGKPYGYYFQVLRWNTVTIFKNLPQLHGILLQLTQRRHVFSKFSVLDF